MEQCLIFSPSKEMFQICVPAKLPGIDFMVISPSEWMNATAMMEISK
jgi:hypothetical protein